MASRMAAPVGTTKTLRAVGAALALASALFAGPAGRAQDAGKGAEDACQAELDRFLHRTRLDPRHLERARICAEYGKMLAAGIPAWSRNSWWRRQLDEAHYGFAKPGATHDPAVLYSFPFDTLIPRLLVQGPGGKSHKGHDQHAVDFMMPIGEPVLAAREGQIARVSDGSSERNSQDPDGDPGNSVLILHDDGTFAEYAHFEPGILVAEGQRVARGEPIALCGNTGYAGGPHVHFVVRRRTNDSMESIPIRFRGPGVAVTPEQGQLYGDLRPPRQPVRVFVDGVLAGERPIPIRQRVTALLRVEVSSPSGGTMDVTADPRTRYAALSIWNLDVEGPGRIVARPARGFLDSALAPPSVQRRGQRGQLLVIYGRPTDPDFAWARVVFMVRL